MSEDLNEYGKLVPKHLAEALKEENARLKAEVERLTKAIDLTIIDLDERHERQDLRAWEFAELLRKAKGVQS
jgi:hypothetical protein